MRWQMSTPTRRLARQSWLSMPRPCLLCGSWDRRSLCQQCLARFGSIRNTVCPSCALPCVSGLICGTCLRDPPPYARCIAAVVYEFPWDRLLSRFKFNDQPELAGLLADLMAEAIDKAGAAAVDCVLPVPLSQARLAERGYNQAWELARRLATRMGLPAHTGVLLRLRDTPHQVGLGRRERARNLRDSMWVESSAAAGLVGRRVALVDDVLTTGVTAAAASQALLRAGVASVQLWALARTPAPHR